MPCHPAICFNPHLEFCPHNPEDIREGKPFLPKKNFPQQGLCEDQQNTTSEAHQQQNQNIVFKKQEKYTIVLKMWSLSLPNHENLSLILETQTKL